MLKQAGGLKEVRTCTIGLTEADQRIAKLSQGIGSSVAVVDRLGSCDGFVEQAIGGRVVAKEKSQPALGGQGFGFPFAVANRMVEVRWPGWQEPGRRPRPGRSSWAQRQLALAIARVLASPRRSPIA